MPALAWPLAHRQPPAAAVKAARRPRRPARAARRTATRTLALAGNGGAVLAGWWRTPDQQHGGGCRRRWEAGEGQVEGLSLRGCRAPTTRHLLSSQSPQQPAGRAAAPSSCSERPSSPKQGHTAGTRVLRAPGQLLYAALLSGPLLYWLGVVDLVSGQQTADFVLPCMIRWCHQRAKQRQPAAEEAPT
jgi:hypothetical protein